MEKSRLKGGSLSGTFLMSPEEAKPFVRKEVSLRVNREYGFQRWYSQLKRMQRYAVIVPNVFPNLISYGMSEDYAYFDMEYMENTITGHDFLCGTTNQHEIKKFFNSLLEVMNRLHSVTISSSKSPLHLYVHEEIERKLEDCMTSDRFKNFIANDYIYFNGNKVPSFILQLDKYKQLANEVYQTPHETFTHGNLTLENILYQPEKNIVTFIDPYEENIIDSVFAEYSQLLQSCSSKYELYNAGTPIINDNYVSMALGEFAGLDYFDGLLKDHISKQYSEQEITVIKLFEVSQFIRMLPFKMVLDEDKMIFFYGLASFIFDNLLHQQGDCNGQQYSY